MQGLQVLLDPARRVGREQGTVEEQQLGPSHGPEQGLLVKIPIQLEAVF